MRLKEVYNYFDSPAAPFSYFLVDRIAAPFVWLNVNYLKIPANFISLISGIFVILTLFAFFNEKFILGGFYYFIAFLLDSIDGPTARATKTTSTLGVVLEAWTDSLRLVGCTFAIGFYLFQKTSDFRWVYLSVVWMVTFASGIWHYTKAKETFKEFNPLTSKKIEGYKLAPFFTWIDLEMIAFFLAPIFGFLKKGFLILVYGYVLTTVVMSIYFVIASKKKKEPNIGNG